MKTTICPKSGRACNKENCRNWIDFPEDDYCTLISIDKHGELTLRQVGERLGISYGRVKQIEDKLILTLRKKGVFFS